MSLRWWADLQFFISALARLRRYANVAVRLSCGATDVQPALDAFDSAVPDLTLMRNIGEHGDEYAVDSERRRVKSVNRRQLEVGSWDGKTYEWIGGRLNVDEALTAAKELFRLLQALRPVDDANRDTVDRG
jgi:hypothetical protein